jgi:cold shock CspA family protein
VRWKNRYDYALKIQELSRIRGDLPAIARFAMAIRHPDVLALAGHVALKIGDTGRAKELLTQGLAEQSLTAAKTLAFIAASESDFPSSCRHFIHFLTSTESLTPSDHDLLIAFGRALNHLPNRELPGLWAIMEKGSDPDTRQLAALLVAFSLFPSHPDVASALLQNDISRAREDLSGNPILSAFHPTSSSNAFNTSSSPPARRLSTGRVTATYSDRGYGFLADSLTGTVYFFKFSETESASLRRTLEAGQSGQQVEFQRMPSATLPQGRYEPATLTRWLDEPIDKPPVQDPQPLPVRRELTALPRGAGAFARAKRAELQGDLALAESEFRKEIGSQGTNWQSAIKDLAWLLSRLERGTEAVALLEQHRRAFDSVRPVDNLLSAILLKLKRYSDAAAIFHRLQSGTDSLAKTRLIRQEAFCYFAQLQFDAALGLLNRIQPLDMETRSLIDRITLAREAQRQGKSLLEDDSDLNIEAFTSGLSPFAQQLLEGSDLRGLDERSKARGYFDEKDFSAVEGLFNGVRGRRPRERAPYCLTLAKMSFDTAEATGSRNGYEYLRRYFAYMGEAAIYDNLHRDAARCYLAEALCYADADSIEIPLALLVSTYLPSLPSAAELSSEIRMQNILGKFSADARSWDRFASDFPYYSCLSVEATRRLGNDIARNRCVNNFIRSAPDLDQKRNAEEARIRKEATQLRALQDLAYGASVLQDHATQLSRLADKTRFDLDRQRLNTVASLCADAAVFWQEQDYVEKESQKSRLMSGLTTLLHEMSEAPTRLSWQGLQPVGKRLMDAVDEAFQAFQRSAKPEITLRNVLGEDYSILSDDGTLPVSLQLASKPGSAPVEGIEIVISENTGVSFVNPVFSPEVLKGGQTRELRALLTPSTSQVADGTFTLAATVTYRTRQGEVGATPEFKLPIRLGSAASFEVIDNPYQSYSGGTVVDSPEMFFGRQSLLHRIESEMTGGAVGQCFVMYGQKRSGKSSILRQLERRIQLPVVSVPITLGEMDVKDAENSFIRLCIDRLHDRLSMDHGIQVPEWVSPREITERPLEAFKNAFRTAKSSLRCAVSTDQVASPRIVLLVDEFTYLFEYIKEGIIPATFMRHWKALLQLELFSAVVVGQDSMPKFKQTFANEFGVTHDERITYLAPEEAAKLAESPISLDGRSRYRGKALERLLDLTAGSPFYLQIMCDRLVRYLNRQRAVFVTEADIDIVARELVSGDSALPVERFDPLITAAGESVAEASRDTYVAVLNAVAHQSRQGGFARIENIRIPTAKKLLGDLADREVVALDSSGRVSIRVQLFAEWLRTNCANDQEEESGR